MPSEKSRLFGSFLLSSSVYIRSQFFCLCVLVELDNFVFFIQPRVEMHTLSCNTLHTLSWNTLNTLSYPFVLSTIQRYRNLSVMTHRAFVPLRFLLHSGSSEQLMMWNFSIWKSCSWQRFNRGVELCPHVRTQVLSCSYMHFYWRRNP